MKKVKEQGIKSSKILEIVKDLRNALPFAMVNTNPQNEIAKLMTYKSSADAAASGKNIVIGDDTTSLQNSTIVKSWPNITTNNINASKIILVDLKDSEYVWDYEEANKVIKKTSWYNELGPPPIHGFFIINSAKTAIHWVDRENDNLEVYMTFDSGVDNVFNYSGTEYCNDIYFKDFKLYASFTNGNRLAIIDFLKDDIGVYNENGYYKYLGNISERNKGQGLSNQYITNSIVNSDVKSVRVVPQYSMSDIFGRPEHYWIVGTAGGLSVYHPKNKQIYDSSVTTSIDLLEVTEDGNIITYTNGGWGHYNSVFEIDTDGFSTRFNSSYAGTFGNKIPISNTAICNDMSFFYGDRKIALYGTDEGLILHYINKNLLVGSAERGRPESDNAKILISSSSNTPYMKGEVVACYTLNNGDISDKGTGTAKNLTNYGSVPFVSGHPYGGTIPSFSNNKYFYYGTSNDFNVNIGEDLSYSVWFKTDTTTIPSGNEWIFIVSTNPYTGQNNNYGLAMNLHALLAAFDASGNNETMTTDPLNLYDAAWHHVVVNYRYNYKNNADHWSEMWLDGKLIIQKQTSYFGSYNVPCNEITIGGYTSDGVYGTDSDFDGVIANLCISKIAMTREEIEAEHARGRQALSGGYTYKLTSNNVDNVKVDPISGYAIVSEGGKLHLMDIRTGIIHNSYDAPNGSLNDVKLLTVQGSDLPHIIFGGNNYIKQIAGDNYIGGIQ